VAQKFHFAILRIEVTRASRGLSAIAELLVTLAVLTLTFRIADLLKSESITNFIRAVHVANLVTHDILTIYFV